MLESAQQAFDKLLFLDLLLIRQFVATPFNELIFDVFEISLCHGVLNDLLDNERLLGYTHYF